ncbi:CDC10 [Ecytonucleospora hepatopenaei]|uniref:CDC10 n=1 Tax=Ecytonucleospora hepatopenaei TaxID=646526 RepID=A0A1W0E823_9MICR|nr:CDC10 [Ecytonucleospora hepatopenaei]
MNITDEETIILTEPVGFTCIPDQMREKSIENGFKTNILVVGRRGLGTKTLINSIFNAPLLSSHRSDDINTVISELVENTVKLRVGITTCHKISARKEVFNFIKAKNEMYFEEKKLVFGHINDQRIHLCIFMLPNDSVSDEEIEYLNELSEYTNVIPVVAKADVYTENELSDYISFLNTKIKTEKMYSPIMSVTASEEIHDIDGIQVRGRRYPWGFIRVEKVLDFAALQRMVVYENYEDFHEKIDNIFYTNYREEIASNSFDKTKMYRKLVEQMKTIRNKKFEAKKAVLEKEELDLEKFLSATKFTSHQSESTE